MFKSTLCAILFLVSHVSYASDINIDVCNVCAVETNQLLELHNKERSAKKLGSLIVRDDLAKYAQKHAEWMANNRSMRHSNIRNILKNGYLIAGENIAYGYTSEQKVMAGWMSSRRHRANILNSKFAYAGFGVAKSKNGTIYWCVVFAGPKSVQN